MFKELISQSFTEHRHFIYLNNNSVRQLQDTECGPKLIIPFKHLSELMS